MYARDRAGAGDPALGAVGGYVYTTAQGCAAPAG